LPLVVLGVVVVGAVLLVMLRGWAPLADVFDTPEAYLLEIELPGLARDSIDVQVEGRELTVRGERHPGGGRSATFHRLERQYGPFARSFRFDVDIDAESVRAEIRDGLLIPVPPSEPLSADDPVRVSGEIVQFGLTRKEIDRMEERIHKLIERVDAGKIALF